MTYTLYNHQQKGVELGKVGSRAFFWDCGTGKSLLGLSLIEHFKSQNIGPALVICPLSIIEAAWVNDCRKFTPDLSIVSLHCKKPAERKQRLAADHDIYVANPEKLKALYDLIVAKDFGVVIVDESSMMKSPNTQITKALLSLAGIIHRGSPYRNPKPIPYRYVLSGTPAPNDQSEYWAQVKFITGPGKDCFPENFYVFRARYFYSIDIGKNRKIFRFRQSEQQGFMDAMKPVCDVVRKKDVADLPEQVHEIRKIYLSSEEQKAYNTLKKDLVLEFSKEDVLASTALTEILKLRQLSSGFIYGENDVHVIGRSKLKELRDLLEQIGDHQVIIWANFKYEIRAILEMLGNKAGALWSGTKDRDRTIKDFQDNKIQYLISNPMSAAHGLSFDNCKYNIDFSMNYSYEFFKQSRDRTHGMNRGIKGQSTTYYYLLADGTIDEVIYKIVAKKGDLSKGVLEYIRQ